MVACRGLLTRCLWLHIGHQWRDTKEAWSLLRLQISWTLYYWEHMSTISSLHYLDHVNHRLVHYITLHPGHFRDTGQWPFFSTGHWTLLAGSHTCYPWSGSLFSVKETFPSPRPCIGVPIITHMFIASYFCQDNTAFFPDYIRLSQLFSTL